MRGNISRLVSTVAVNIRGLCGFSHLVFLGTREFLLFLRAAGRHCAAIVEKVAILTEQDQILAAFHALTTVARLFVRWQSDGRILPGAHGTPFQPEGWFIRVATTVSLRSTLPPRTDISNLQ